MKQGCAGQDNKNLTSAMYRCPSCGAPVEIFSDETRYRCKCGTVVRRERAPSCWEWCSSARKCLGEERYNKLMAERGVKQNGET